MHAWSWLDWWINELTAVYFHQPELNRQKSQHASHVSEYDPSLAFEMSYPLQQIWKLLLYVLFVSRLAFYGEWVFHDCIDFELSLLYSTGMLIISPQTMASRTKKLTEEEVMCSSHGHLSSKSITKVSFFLVMGKFKAYRFLTGLRV